MEDRQVANFTWYPSYTEACEEFESPEDRHCFMEGLINYGTYGIEPEFDKRTLRLAFICARPNIDNSRNGSLNGKRGSDKKKEKAEAERRKAAEMEYAVPSDVQAVPSDMPTVEDVNRYVEDVRKRIESRRP